MNNIVEQPCRAVPDAQLTVKRRFLIVGIRLMIVYACALQSAVAVSQVSIESATEPLAVPARSETASIRGVVVDREGNALPRAFVELSPFVPRAGALNSESSGVQDQLRAITDSGGRFEFIELEPQGYQLQVSKNGFVRTDALQSITTVDGDELAVEPGDALELTVQLERAGLIVGRVYGSRIQPLPRVRVRAFQLRTAEDGSVVRDAVASALTDDLGDYRFYWLTPGEYVVEASVSNSPAHHTSENMAPIIGYETVFYPGVKDWTLASSVVLSPGDQVSGIDLVLGQPSVSTQFVSDVQASGAVIGGIVTRDGSGESLGGAIVELTLSTAIQPARRRDTVSEQFAVTTGDGRFVFDGLDPGQYRLDVSLDGFVRHQYGQARLGGRGTVLDLSADEEVELPIQMTAAGTIVGRVFDTSGDPLPEVAVRAFQFQYQPGGSRRLDIVQTAVTNDRGEYRLFWLTPGRYLVAATQVGPFAGDGFALTPNMAPGEAFAPTFYPGVADSGNAFVIPLMSNDISNRFDFEVEPAQTVQLRGRILTFIEGARPANNLSITPIDSGIPGSMRLIRTDEDGSFFGFRI